MQERIVHYNGLYCSEKSAGKRAGLSRALRYELENISNLRIATKTCQYESSKRNSNDKYEEDNIL
jgi:hypothetical protein